MSNIEILSIAKLDIRIANTAHLAPQIKRNDKDLSWDGDILIFSDVSERNKDHRKDKLIGRMPVQVKGKMMDYTPSLKKNTKYPVEIADLRNYLNDGGVLFFVIEVFLKETDDADDYDFQIFYDTLTPEKINKILERYGEQQRHSVEFKLFPKSKKHIESIIRNSYETCRRQHSNMGKCISPTSIDLKNDRMHIPIFEYDKSKLVLETLFENGVHAYCVKPDGTEQPLFNFNNVTSIEAKSTACVCFSNCSIELESNSLKTQTECTVSIGGFLTIHKYPDKLTYEFHESEWYYENVFYTDMLLYLNDTDDKKIEINGVGLIINDEFFSTIDMDYVRQLNTELYSIKKYLDALRSNYDFTITHDNRRDISLGVIIYECTHHNKYITKDDIVDFIDDELVSSLKQREIKFLQINFLNRKLLICITKYDNNKYAIIDPFFIHQGLLRNERGESITIYDELIKLDYYDACNINYDLLLNSYNGIESNSSRIVLATNTLINLLGAYDMILTKRYQLKLEEDKYSKKILKVANDLSEWVVKNNSDENFSIKAKINILQTIHRKRAFNEDEIEQIKGMIDNTQPSNIDEKFALYLLLNDQTHAQKLFETLSVKDQEFYRTMPIFHFAHFQKSEQAE